MRAITGACGLPVTGSTVESQWPFACRPGPRNSRMMASLARYEPLMYQRSVFVTRLDTAITLPEEAATEMVVAAALEIAPKLRIVARASTHSGVHRLYDLGAQGVIHPELEGGLEVVRHTLLALGFPADQIEPYTSAVRGDHYDTAVTSPK